MSDPKTTELPKHEVLFRDWKEQVDADEIDQAIQLVFDGRHAPHLYDADTGQDAYAIVVSALPMTPEQVQAAWRGSNDDD